jgi:hypothetical protein
MLLEIGGFRAQLEKDKLKSKNGTRVGRSGKPSDGDVEALGWKRRELGALTRFRTQCLLPAKAPIPVPGRPAIPGPYTHITIYDEIPSDAYDAAEPNSEQVKEEQRTCIRICTPKRVVVKAPVRLSVGTMSLPSTACYQSFHQKLLRMSFTVMQAIGITGI